MDPTHGEPLLDTLIADFGGNYVFALDLLGEYQRDPSSVDGSWRDYFDRLSGVRSAPAEVPPATVPTEPGEPPPEPGAAPIEDQPAAPAGTTPRSNEAGAFTSLVSSSAAVAPAPARSRSLVGPAILPGDIAQPIRGGALRVVENMEASLFVPTATSIRTMPVRTLEENRAILNKHRASTGAGKISFTHIVAWAILRALDTFPRLNDAYAELDGAGAPDPAGHGASRSGRRRAEEGRQPEAARAEHQGRQQAGLRGVPGGLSTTSSPARERARSRPTTSWARR